MDEELLLQMLSDPQMSDQIAQMSAYGDRAALLGKDTQRADALRAIQSPQGRYVGNTYVASSPLEHLGAVAQRALGERQLAGARGGYDKLIQGDVTARKGIASALADAMRRVRQPAGAPEEPIQAPQMVGEEGLQ